MEEPWGIVRGGGIDKLAGSAWASVVLGSAWRPLRFRLRAAEEEPELGPEPEAVIDEGEERLCEVEFERAGSGCLVTGSWEGRIRAPSSVDVDVGCPE